MDTVQSTKRDISGAIVSTCVAGRVATAAMLAAAVAFDYPSLTELVAEAVTRATPLELIEHMIALLGSDAKHLVFNGVLVGQVAVAATFGMVAGRRGWTRRRISGVFSAIVLATGIGLIPLVGAGILATDTRSWPGLTLLGLAIGNLVFLASYGATWRYLHPRGFFAIEEAAARRKFLKNSAVTIGAIAATVGGFRWLAAKLEPPPVASSQSVEAGETVAAIASAPSLVDAIAAGIPGLSPEITPNGRFYVVSKNFFRDPEVSQESWRLEVAGSLDRPATLTYDQMRALPSSTQYLTLQCISNEVGGSLIGNALWRGTSLADLLRAGGVRSSAVDVILHAVDGYTDSIPLAKAMQPDTMLAYEMNGEVLPQIHGFPVRLLVPDIYGMKNVKWIAKIEVVDYDYKGYWMTKGWTDTAIMHTTSRIDFPKGGSFLRPGSNYVGGVAVAGQRGITSVDVSTDGGASWSQATIKPPLGPNAWSQWLFSWELPTDEPSAERKLLVRATDGMGELQTPTVRDTLPEGSSGYHTVVVRRATT